MKRKEAPSNAKGPKAKKQRPHVPDYHLTPTVKDEHGEAIWPAPKDEMKAARDFILEWHSNTIASAQSHKPTLLVPDKDADGLTSAAILHHTLTLLGLPTPLISTYLLQKGTTVHTPSSLTALAAHSPSYLLILDHGSRASPPLIPSPCKTLVIDHHFARHSPPGDFPAGAVFCNACHCPPVATTSLLTYLLCLPLHPGVHDATDWLCALGTHGDLGTALKWGPPFPDMAPTFKKYTKKAINDAVALLNAPRRTAAFDVCSAWAALSAAKEPKDMLRNERLLAARAEVNAEVQRCTHTAPRFSGDGRVALFRIKSGAQVHPLIATRWAAHLSSRTLEIVMVANEGYLPDKVHFSCRTARSARAREPPVDIIASLKAMAAAAAAADPSGTLLERLGEDFAKGHVQASGGVVGVREFEELVGVIGLGLVKKGEEDDAVEGEGGEGEGQGKAVEKGRQERRKAGALQKNTLMKYFGKVSA